MRELDAELKTSVIKKKLLTKKGIRTYQSLYIAAGLLNFLLILFDYFYLEDLPFGSKTLRDFSLEHFPAVSRVYDPMKGIEPHRFTETYLDDYRIFKKAVLSNDVKIKNQTGQTLNARLENMIDWPYGSGPFSSGKGDGRLEVVKNYFRNYFGMESARDAGREFFLPVQSPELSEWQRRFEFFDRYIVPEFQENYYRSLDEDGRLYDHFYLIDRWFVFIFIGDFILRWAFFVFFMRGKWFVFPMRRWYEVFNLFYPHHAAWFRFMRAIPLYLRIRENGFLADDGLMTEIIHDNASVIAKEISTMVLSNLMLQASGMIGRMDAKDLRKFMTEENGENLHRIVKDVSDVVLKDVLPALSDDVALYVRNILRNTLDPWLTTPLAPLVRLFLLNLEITIQDTVDTVLYSEAGSHDQRKILAKFIEETLNRLAHEENFVPLKKDLTVFLETMGRELAAGKKVD